MKTKLIKESAFKNEARISKYFDQLVGEEGPADTCEGELIRAINRMMYRYHNDGDYFFDGYGTETSGPCAVYLMRLGIPGLREAVNKCTGLYPGEGKNSFTENDPYQTALENIGDIICDYIDSKNGEYTKNTGDCLDRRWYQDAKDMWYEEEEEDYYEEDNYDYDEDNLEEKIGSKLIISINEYKKIIEGFPKKEPNGYINTEGELTNIESDKKLNDAVDAWLIKVQRKSDEYYKNDFPTLMKPTFTKNFGQKFIKILEIGPGQKSAWAFVDNEGNIYKPANFNTAANGARGNVYADIQPLDSGSMYRYK